MPLNSSGPISLAGGTSGQSIALELGQSSTGQISMNDGNVRTLAGVASGQISMNNFYGKSNSVLLSTTTYTTFGYYNYTIPAGVNRIVVTMIAPGGGGAASSYYESYENCPEYEYYVYDGWYQPGTGGGSGAAAKASFNVAGLSYQQIAVYLGNGGGAGSTAGGNNRNGGQGGGASVSFSEDLYLFPEGEPEGWYSVQTLYMLVGSGGGGNWYSFEDCISPSCCYGGTSPYPGTAGTYVTAISNGSYFGADRYIAGSLTSSAGSAAPSVTLSNTNYIGGNGASRSSFQGYSGTGATGGTQAGGSGAPYGSGGAGGGTGIGGGFFLGGGLGGAGLIIIQGYNN